MNAEISIYDYAKEKEKRFSLPCEFNDMKNFITPNRDYEITDVEDDYGFLAEVKAYEDGYIQINELVKLIEENSNEESIVTKLSFHYYQTRCELEDLTNNFEKIIERYEIYDDDYYTSADWVEENNELYNFIKINNKDELYYFFDHSLRKNYLRDLYVTYDFDIEIDEFNNLTLMEIFELLESYDLLYGPYISFYKYLNWKEITKSLRAGAFYVDEFKNKIIVHYG